MAKRKRANKQDEKGIFSWLLAPLKIKEDASASILQEAQVRFLFRGVNTLFDRYCTYHEKRHSDHGTFIREQKSSLQYVDEDTLLHSNF